MYDGTVEDCLAAGEGGGLFTLAAKTTVVGTAFRRNSAPLGGGIYVGADDTLKRKMLIWSGIVEDNNADSGAGIMTADGDIALQVIETTFLGNHATSRGGGLHGGARIVGSTFEGNSAGTFGGGALLHTESRVQESTFRANDAWRGGGLATFTTGDYDFDISDSTFEGNTLSIAPGTPYGAGIFAGRDVNPPPASTTYVRNCTLSQNISVAPNGIGGGLGVAGAVAVVEHTTFYGNEALHGAGIYTSPSGSTDLTLNSSIVARAPGATRDACFMGASLQTTTSLDSDGTCGVAFPNVDPLLAPLSNTGGETDTHVPGASEVLGTAQCDASHDQRGVARPSTDCDIGSVQES